MRVWQLYPRSDETLWYFNSHTREGVTVCCLNKLFSSLFQLTHPWGCDKKRAVWCSKLQAISTHTPVRVWRRRKEACGGWGYFNSHTREGVTCGQRVKITEIAISTHTPVRVWLPGIRTVRQDRHFNSHTREGVTWHRVHSLPTL